VSYSVDHTHCIYLPAPISTNILFRPPYEECLLGAGGVGVSVIPGTDITAGIAKTYSMTIGNDHRHTLSLSAADFAALRAGQTITKQTSRDARPGGRQHVHTVTISCRA
jgi:hypothetical protein